MHIIEKSTYFLDEQYDEFFKNGHQRNHYYLPRDNDSNDFYHFRLVLF